MSSEAAQPPVAYETLNEIAQAACESALSSATKYEHASTEQWNTSIINTILGALVKETTAAASGTAAAANGVAQPQFKYVVNSTIIQHAAGAEDSAGQGTKSAGRRGMHSASGAYWNNEKDGMWSYKYDAAEAKGLDVVVGIIWVWAG